MNLTNNNKEYQALLDTISQVYHQGRNTALKLVDTVLIKTNWQIGQHIVEFEQKGNPRAPYGMALLEQLSNDLKLRHGKGFSRSNLYQMRLFYARYPVFQSISGKLSWSHYCELIPIELDLERQFYEKQSELEVWSLEQLKYHKKNVLFLRLAKSQDKEGVLKLAKQGRIIEKPEDILRDPYVFEFLKIPEPYRLSEKKLETLLLDNLQTFLLELGKGFTFVGRQYRIVLDNEPYKVDLVFYHRFLRCFVLIDLKVNKIQHYDIGQMNMYLGYFANEETTADENPPIGIILTRDKDDLLVKYATYGMNSQLFVSKYQLYLPDIEELRAQLERILNQPNDVDTPQ
jgi:predicted nuclease of restriction endonuclease-like (RecB) superfamily